MTRWKLQCNFSVSAHGVYFGINIIFTHEGGKGSATLAGQQKYYKS